MAYLLDSDVLIQASNLHYSFAICPGFWHWIDREHAKGNIFSVQKVHDEIVTGNDALIHWAGSRKPMFVPTDDPKTYASLAILSSWASKYKMAAQERFFKSADFLLIGFAHAYGHTVVTQEKYSGGEQIKIPNACEAMGVECVNTWDLLTRESVRFVLG